MIVSTAAPASLQEVRVVVVALTYRRPQDLEVLLPMLQHQAANSPARTSVLVVDNDPDAGARDQVTALGPDVRYVHVPTPGIAAARNGALEASSDEDVLIFIDDDERPVGAWLESLLLEWDRTRPAAVVGPVVSEFSVQPDAWVEAGRFFDRRRMPTGSAITVAATNNLLLDLHFVRQHGLRFDLRFGLTGGSDTLFTRTVHKLGGRMVWCDEAVVTDVVPPQRVTRDWVLRRAFRSGNSWATTSAALADGPRDRVITRTRVAIEGVPRLLGGAARLAAGAVLRRTDLRARGMRTIARGAGMVSGSVGVAYVEYRRPKVG